MRAMTWAQGFRLPRMGWLGVVVSLAVVAMLVVGGVARSGRVALPGVRTTNQAQRDALAVGKDGAELVAPSMGAALRGTQSNVPAPGAPGTAGSASSQAAAAASGAAGQGQVVFPNLPAIDRMIVKTGSLTLQVAGTAGSGTVAGNALAAAMQRVNAVVAGIPGAYVAASSTSYRAETPVPAETKGNVVGATGIAPQPLPPQPYPQPRPIPAPAITAMVSLRVPVDAFDQTMQRLREIGSPLAEQVSTQEVTEEYVDLEAQVRNLEATEAQYLRFLERAQRLEEILPIQQRLSEVRGQIERLKGRMTLLQRRSDVSTIALTLVVPSGKAGAPDEPRAVQTLREAWGRLAGALQGLLDVAIYVGVYALPLLPIGAAWMWWRRRQPRSAATAAGGAV